MGRIGALVNQRLSLFFCESSTNSGSIREICYGSFLPMIDR